MVALNALTRNVWMLLKMLQEREEKKERDGEQTCRRGRRRWIATSCFGSSQCVTVYCVIHSSDRSADLARV
jgi:hypothetical protein